MVSIAFSEKYFESLLRLTPNEQTQANKALMQFQQNALAQRSQVP